MLQVENTARCGISPQEAEEEAAEAEAEAEGEGERSL